MPVGNLLVAQLAFVVCSLTILFLIPAAVALQRTMEAILVEDENSVLRCFARELHGAVRPYLAAGLALSLLSGMLTVSIFFWAATGGPPAVVALIVLIPLAGMLTAGYLTALAVLAGPERPPLRATLFLAAQRLRNQPLHAGACVVVLVTWGLLMIKLPTMALIGSGLVPALLAFWLRYPRGPHGDVEKPIKPVSS